MRVEEGSGHPRGAGQLEEGRWYIPIVALLLFPQGPVMSPRWKDPTGAIFQCVCSWHEVTPTRPGLESPSTMPSSFQGLCRLPSAWLSKACLHIPASPPGEHPRGASQGSTSEPKGSK